MATRKYAIETIEAEQEESTEFTEADIESLEFAPEDLEDLEAELTENISLEDVDPESVAESLEMLMEGEAIEQQSGSYARPSPGRSVNKELLKTFTTLVRKMLKKITTNSRTRVKMEAAIRKGPKAVALMVQPTVRRELPVFLHWLVPIYVPMVTTALFPSLRQQTGIPVEEVEEASEFYFNGSF